MVLSDMHGRSVIPPGSQGSPPLALAPLEARHADRETRRGEELMLRMAEHARGRPAVGLEQILAARKRRAARQAAAVARFGKPLVSVTVVMPGPVKDGQLPRRVMREALRALATVADDKRWRVLSGEGRWQHTGPEALFVVDAGGWSLKSATVELEEHHPLGGLWDLDVFAPQGLVTRRQLGLPARRCLACERPAYVCGHSGRHPPEELCSTIRQLVGAYDLRSVA